MVYLILVIYAVRFRAVWVVSHKSDRTPHAELVAHVAHSARRVGEGRPGRGETASRRTLVKAGCSPRGSAGGNLLHPHQ